ncbi:hypothetical protein I7331_05100 [Frankia sp. AgB1.8]|nr:hypothetical protein [Frankia sp. AgB1.8]
MSRPSTFLDACLVGRALLADVDDWVDTWHEADGAPDGHPVALREYLGLGPAEYAMWVEQPGALRFAAQARRTGRPVDDLKALTSTVLAAARTGDDSEAQTLIQWLQETGRLSADDLEA